VNTIQSVFDPGFKKGIGPDIHKIFDPENFSPDTTKWKLRLVHHGGDYGNFLSWFLHWLLQPIYVTFDEALWPDGSMHGAMCPYLQRWPDPADASKFFYRFSGHRRPDEHSILRMHLLGYHDKELYGSGIRELELLCKQGPTVIIDHTDSIFELANNRKEKMPSEITSKDADTVINSLDLWYRFYKRFLPKEPMHNLYKISMSDLTQNTFDTTMDLLEWWGVSNRINRSIKEIHEVIARWQQSQKHFGKDQLICNIVNEMKQNDKTSSSVLNLTNSDISAINFILDCFDGFFKYPLTPKGITEGIILFMKDRERYHDFGY
jgi:hypothetical protein